MESTAAANPFPPMSGNDFAAELLAKFPALASEIHEHHGLPHVISGTTKERWETYGPTFNGCD